MTTGIDFSTPHGERALARLGSEQIIWLSTVARDGTPQPSPVWFDWQDDHVVIYSQPDAPKVQAIGRNPNVSLHFNCTEQGGNVVIFRGVAEIVDDDTPATENAQLIAKYADAIAGSDFTTEWFAAEYSTLIRVRLTRLIGH